MSGHAEALQKIFKTLSDPTRIRILRLLEQEELIVGELMDILGMAQSRVSRHLAILREAGLLTDRRDGTFVAYRLVLPEDGPWHDAWALARRYFDGSIRDEDVVLRAGKAANGDVVLEWDQVRGMFYTMDSSTELGFAPLSGPHRAESDRGQLVLPAGSVSGRNFYRVCWEP